MNKTAVYNKFRRQFELAGKDQYTAASAAMRKAFEYTPPTHAAKAKITAEVKAELDSAKARYRNRRK